MTDHALQVALYLLACVVLPAGAIYAGSWRQP